MGETSKEIWKDIPGYEGLYQVSNFGRVKSFIQSHDGKILKTTKQNGGYLILRLCKDGDQKMVTVHRIVANTFLPNPKGLRDVNHKNGIKTDNRVENLEWISHSDNIKHSYRELNRAKNEVSVVCLETGKKYKSCKEAAEKTGINKCSINHVINGISKMAGGFTWARN